MDIARRPPRRQIASHETTTIRTKQQARRRDALTKRDPLTTHAKDAQHTRAVQAAAASAEPADPLRHDAPHSAHCVCRPPLRPSVCEAPRSTRHSKSTVRVASAILTPSCRCGPQKTPLQHMSKAEPQSERVECCRVRGMRGAFSSGPHLAVPRSTHRRRREAGPAPRSKTRVIQSELWAHPSFRRV